VTRSEAGQRIVKGKQADLLDHARVGEGEGDLTAT
jgi:hypothetical protein